MSFLHMFGLKVERTPGPTIELDCPQCKRRTRAQNECRIETVSVLHLVPLFKKTTNRLVCQTCGGELVGVAAGSGVVRRNHVKGQVRYERRRSPEVRFLAIISVFLALMPGAGTPLTIIAAIVCWRGGGWPKVTTVAAVGLSIVVGLFYFAVVSPR